MTETTTSTSTDSTATDQPATEEPTLESVCEQLEALTERVTDLEAEVTHKNERIEELEAKLAEYKQFVGAEFADVRGRITDVEEQAQAQAHTRAAESTDATPEDESPSQSAATPLERICGLPEQIADRELTTNQERARFIARDIRDYAEKAPAGLVIDSRAIKRVITASEGKRPHTQTVARVMDFLDDLGKEDVQQKKRRGKKFVVVDPKAATRYATHHDRCDGGSGSSHAEGVISNG
jgi:vacuolar-type H+-ATPase subunit I/STV1